MKKCFFLLLIFTFFLSVQYSYAQFTRQDTLRGSNGPGRDWWDVSTYNILIEPDYNSKTIKGWNEISFKILNGGFNKQMQIDLQEPLKIENITLDNKEIKILKREGNVYWLDVKTINFQNTYKEGNP